MNTEITNVDKIFEGYRLSGDQELLTADRQKLPAFPKRRV
jgi:hypothetical protein